VASIILGGRDLTAVAAFDDQYRLAVLRAICVETMQGFDVLLTPTVPDVPTVDEVGADPIGTNTALGRFTNFTNLLGLAVTAVPDAGRADGVPSGISVVGSAGADHLTLDVAALLVGEEPSPRAGAAEPRRIELAVVGAHLSGQPLNHQLTDRGARLVRRTQTAAAYRLHALDTSPPKPGLRRVHADGGALEVEVWSLDPAAFGSFVAEVPAPLAIGKIELGDGAVVAGFVCEPHAFDGAADVTAFGGWRSYLSGG
jgi:allophanate hydrolase